MSKQSGQLAHEQFLPLLLLLLLLLLRLPAMVDALRDKGTTMLEEELPDEDDDDVGAQ